jgi:hypothetical protein
MARSRVDGHCPCDRLVRHPHLLVRNRCRNFNAEGIARSLIVERQPILAEALARLGRGRIIVQSRIETWTLTKPLPEPPHDGMTPQMRAAMAAIGAEARRIGEEATRASKLKRKRGDVGADTNINRVGAAEANSACLTILARDSFHIRSIAFSDERASAATSFAVASRRTRGSQIPRLFGELLEGPSPRRRGDGTSARHPYT